VPPFTVAAFFFLVDVQCRQRRDLEKRGVGVEQPLDAFARQQLAARGVALAR
jgi:hypothetical protein